VRTSTAICEAAVPAPTMRALADVGVSAVPAAQERWFAAPEVKRALVRLRGARAADPAQSAVAAAEEALLAEGWLPEVERDTGPLDPIRRLADQLGSAATVADLVADLTEREELAAPPLPEAVTVTTLHAAKGREWDAVFIPGLIEGLLPVAPALTEEALAEERRLLYVGITRARRDLYLSWYEGAARRSRFLDDLAVAES
jgi:DNA helicase II / ATP-dependent DNA helicase PcrA